MIDGLKIELTSADLKAALMERVAYHENRASAYKRSVASIDNPEDDELDEGLSNDPRRGARQRLHSHLYRAALFRFLQDHLIPDEVYRLSEDDLLRLELISGRY